MANAADGQRDAREQQANSKTPLLQRNRHDAEHGNATTTGDAASQSSGNEWESDEVNNPQNWKRWYKWTLVILVSFIEFLTTMPNFMYAPNLTDAEEDLNTTNDTLATFSLTIYILGFALGPLLFGPLTEVYGRAPVYRLCLVAFLCMTLGCGLAQNIEMLVAFRFLAGSFGAAPVAIGGAVVGDLFVVEERGRAMSIYQAGQIISAVVGPPIGGLIGAYLVWRWVFWIVCILAALALICCVFILRETHHQTLQRKLGSKGGPGEDAAGGLASVLKDALMRPVQMLVRSPVVFAGCILIFVVIGLLNVFLTELSRTVQQVYHVSSGQSGTMYLGLALGFVAASVLFGLTNDRIMAALTKRHGGETEPEFRLPATIAAMPIVVIGTLWYGWTLERRNSWIVPIIGSGVAGLGITTVQLSVTTYMIDSFDTFSASALAAVTMARSVGGAILPLAGPPLFKALGQGWGNTILAGLAALCSVLPVLMYIFGSRWRAMFSSEDLMN
ncbi:major facilitator superfamily domain-containing protein [Neohortaea acidophila]|uniref:Major facilitator superfamily domain-containing protein n=1 Tax=Neohortaea acidophila TaxID=245834 RepID=A0A6A6PQB0_9PEZI|nr:major facilitator superfamily domain-containing protein [Neohortaea acidophila]KAF2482125.1 major facilitator superfamily domain-containing protein [Neohortaea acidophila]